MGVLTNTGRATFSNTAARRHVGSGATDWQNPLTRTAFIGYFAHMPPRLLLAFFFTALIVARAQVPEPVLPVLKEYCLDCHNAKKQKGDLDLEPLLADPKFAEQRETWEKAIDLLNSHEMPPEKKPQPSEEQRQLLTQYIDGALTSYLHT